MPVRKSTQLVILTIYLDAGAFLFEASGLADAMGINTGIGAQKKVDAALKAFSSINPGGGLGDTLFALFVTVTRTVSVGFELVFALPTMLINLGVPTLLVGFVFAPAPVIVARDLIYLLIGRGP